MMGRKNSANEGPVHSPIGRRHAKKEKRRPNKKHNNKPKTKQAKEQQTKTKTRESLQWQKKILLLQFKLQRKLQVLKFSGTFY
jgi:hypothetical protein